ncbi:MAG: HEAT repeat domain-containing protein [Pseudomonadota bacterium]
MTGCADETLGLPDLTRDALLKTLDEPGGGPDGVRAIREITRRRLPQARAVLQKLVATTDAVSPAKAAAIRALGAQADPEAEAFLVERLARASPAETGQIARALARTGTQRALEGLAEVRVEPGTTAGRAVATARRFIAFRNGQRGEEIDVEALPKPLPQLRDGVQKIEQRIIPAEALEREAKEIRAAVPELDLASDTALELTCKGGVQWLVPHAKLADPETIAQARERPGVAFALLSRDPCVSGLFFDSYVLSQPERDGSIGLYVTRLSGDIKLAGRADPSDRGVGFRLDALNIRRNPGAITIAGRLGRSGQLELSEAISAAARAEAQVARRRAASAVEAPI